MHNNFLISGYGRSGTKFLSSIMNTSKKWTVLHEPRGSFEEDQYWNNKPIPEKVKSDFNRNYYGEVNSRLRFYFKELNVSKKGIIIREPKDIILSVCNRGKSKEDILLTIRVLNDYYNKFIEWTKESTFFKIDFAKMTSDVSYLNSILQYFGIDDVIIDNKIIKIKINENLQRNIIYKSFEDIPNEFKDEYFKLKW
jgi:hypothetical protein